MLAYVSHHHHQTSTVIMTEQMRATTTDHIRYDVLARDALRGVLRKVLSDAAAHGLPGEHHFFITFFSTAEGVKQSPRLLAQ